MTRTPRRSQLGPALVLALATLAARPALVLALAALAPAGLAGAQPIDAWIDGLTAPKWEAREMAAINLGRFPARAKPALPALIRALDDSHPRVRMAVAGALFQLGPAAAEATPILIEHLRRDPDPKVRQLSAIALGQIGPPAAEALPALVEALRDPSDGVRLRAAVAAEVFDPQASRPVDALVHDLRGDGPTRLRAGWALSQAGAAAAPAIDALVAALGDPDRSVQLVATVALEQIGRPVEAAIPDLVRAAEAGNWHAGSVLEHLGKAARARGQPSTGWRPTPSGRRRSCSPPGCWPGSPSVRGSAPTAPSAPSSGSRSCWSTRPSRPWPSWACWCTS